MKLKYLLFSIISTYFKVRYRRLEIGKGVRMYPGCSIAFLYSGGKGEIKIGNNAVIGSLKYTYRMGWYHPTRLSIMGGQAKISIGDDTFLNGVNVCAKKSVSIGSRCHFASGVQILDYNGHLIYQFDRRDGDEPQAVSIGDNVWIGLNAIILKGSIIGDNSVVAAGSVVKGEFEPFSLISGNPARLIKRLDRDKFA